MSERRVHITQGEMATGSDPDTVVSTLLGSCVSCCLWDAVAGVGGMNHILLAKPNGQDHSSALAGINAMEILINAVIKLGADRTRLKAKAFGGASMFKGLSGIGSQNAEFVTTFLAQEGIPLVTQSFGGRQARSLMFWPATGRALQKLSDKDVSIAEVAPMVSRGHGVELF